MKYFTRMIVMDGVYRDFAVVTANSPKEALDVSLADKTLFDGLRKEWVESDRPFFDEEGWQVLCTTRDGELETIEFASITVDDFAVVITNSRAECRAVDAMMREGL